MIERIWKRRDWGCEDGATLVETALSMLIFLAFLIGVIEVSFGLYSYHFISSAAREGTRYAIVRGSTCSGFASACPAQVSDIQSYVKNLGFPGINPGNMNVSVAWAPYPPGAICSPCNNPGNLVTVTVQYSFPLTVPFVPAHTFTMTSQSAMVIAQ